MLSTNHNLYLDATIAEQGKQKDVSSNKRKHDSALRALYAIILTPDSELLASVRKRGLHCRHVQTCVALESLIAFEAELAEFWFDKNLFLGEKVRLPRGRRNALLVAVFPFLMQWGFARYRPYLGITCLPVLRPVSISEALEHNGKDFSKLKQMFDRTCGTAWRNVNTNRPFRMDDLVLLMQKHFTQPSAIVRSIVRFRSTRHGNIRHELGTTVVAAIKWCDEFVTPYPLPGMLATTGKDPKQVGNYSSSSEEEDDFVIQYQYQRRKNAKQESDYQKESDTNDNDVPLDIQAQIDEIQREFNERISNITKAVRKA